jgi:hypothetical protein
MRGTDPEAWKQAVAFDRTYRNGSDMLSELFLHISCKPLDEPPIDTIRRADFDQLDLLVW